MKLRDMLVREGMESLSGAVSLIQYYNRPGTRSNTTIPLKI
jgi:hypothetical protein